MTNKSMWEDEFDRRFVRSDGLMDKYVYKDDEVYTTAEAIKEFIRELLEDKKI